MTTDERIDRLTGVVESLAASVVHHDNQIGGLITIAEAQARKSVEIDRRMDALIQQ